MKLPKTAAEARRIRAEYERARRKLGRSIDALRDEVFQSKLRVSQATWAYSKEASLTNRRKLALARKAWKAHVKVYEALMGEWMPALISRDDSHAHTSDRKKRRGADSRGPD